eukprot:7337686-Lingulodinium_polyedra.AAC.1
MWPQFLARHICGRVCRAWAGCTKPFCARRLFRIVGPFAMAVSVANTSDMLQALRALEPKARCAREVVPQAIA